MTAFRSSLPDDGLEQGQRSGNRYVCIAEFAEDDSGFFFCLARMCCALPRTMVPYRLTASVTITVNPVNSPPLSMPGQLGYHSASGASLTAQSAMMAYPLEHR